LFVSNTDSFISSCSLILLLWLFLYCRFSIFVSSWLSLHVSFFFISSSSFLLRHTFFIDFFFF